MINNKDQKIVILKAYLNGSIDKEQMQTFLIEGITLPPIQWIFETLEELKKDTIKRAIISNLVREEYRNIDWD